MKNQNTLSIYDFIIFISGLVDCLNDEDCLGAERKCFRNITLHEGKCVCNEGYKQAKEDPIKCLSIGMYIKSIYISLHISTFDAFFRQIKSFFQLKGKKPKNKSHVNFYKCCHLTKKVYLMYMSLIFTFMFKIIPAYKSKSEAFHTLCKMHKLDYIK